MMLQCWRVKDDEGPCVCVLVRDYPDSTQPQSVMADAVTQKLAIHPGLYLVTRPEIVGSGQPYTDSIVCYTLQEDMSFGEGATMRVPRLTSWPPKIPRTKG